MYICLMWGKDRLSNDYEADRGYFFDLDYLLKLCSCTGIYMGNTKELCTITIWCIYNNIYVTWFMEYNGHN